ncbi:MAG: hypothetical protein R3F56_02115 [Planctomycetota bacterium]
MTLAILLTASLPFLAAPQTQTQSDDAALAAFDRLPVLRQAMLVRRVEQRLRQEPDPALRRIASLHADETDTPPATPAPTFDPDEWAPGVAPARHVVEAGSAEHAAVRRAMPASALLPDLARQFDYDWVGGRVVRRPALTWRERFANLLHGYPPDADAAFARVVAALDHDPGHRILADYFGHLYADRQGRVFAGITLYQAWYAGTTLEMPDVDCIAFAVRVLGDTSFESPIPADGRRQRLYTSIEARALAHRKYRTMLEAAAAAFVRAEPVLDGTYGRLAPRFHYLFRVCDDDLDAVRAELVRVGSRDALVAHVDDEVTKNSRAMALRDTRAAELTRMADTVRTVTLDALHVEGQASRR